MIIRPHQYDLAFVSSGRTPGTPPEIIFIISQRDFSELREILHKITFSDRTPVDRYFQDSGTVFSLPYPDLFGNIEFGYGGCGYCTENEEKLFLRIPLGVNKKVLYCAQTVRVLSSALIVPFEQKLRSTQTQQVIISTLADCDGSLHGHSVGGEMSLSVINWLSRYAKTQIDTRKGQKGLGSVNMHPAVIKAMQEAWCSLHSVENHASAKECCGNVLPEGHFKLICSGNSCDLSVYPDQELDDDEAEFVDLDCHNLDSAHQQLTLLAGLAKLCELAREDS